MLTNSVALSPRSTTAMLPHGSLMFGVDHVDAILPCGSSTIRQPAPLVLVVPSLLGVLPTITQPDFSIVIAVDRPTPPGHAFRSRGIDAGRLQLLRRRAVVDDRAAGALQVRRVVEVVDEHVARLDRAGRHRRDRDRVRVLVAVVRHRVDERGVAMHGLETLRLGECAGGPSARRRPVRPSRDGEAGRMDSCGAPGERAVRAAREMVGVGASLRT